MRLLKLIVYDVNIRLTQISSDKKVRWAPDKLMVKGFSVKSKAILMIMALRHHINIHRAEKGI